LHAVGTPFLNQPSTTALVPPQGVSTSYSNVRLALSGSIEVRIGGNCVWCDSFAGTSVSRGGAAIMSGFSQTLRTDEFATSTVPEPSTLSAAALSLCALAVVRQRARRKAQG
jgi:hypothetical protein